MELFSATDPSANLLVTVSVRTAWSLLLKVLDLPKGSEILMTSINIPDMAQIVREYGLIPVPVDIHLESTAPTLDDIKAVVTPKVYSFFFVFQYHVTHSVDKSADALLHLWNRVPDPRNYRFL